MKIPRIVIAATGSGVGKTTVTVAIIAALRARGLKVSTFKCGPDYLDPTYHQRASGRPSSNLDTWMMGRAGVLGAFIHAAQGADIAIIEGMMGLYDSAAPDTDEGSTAELAKYLEAPVVLVADTAGVARTISAIALGFARFDPALKLAGLICNGIGGRGHLDLLRQARPQIPIAGGFPRIPEASFPERHLGLFTANASNLPDELVMRWGALAEEWLDLDAIIALARTAPDCAGAAPLGNLPSQSCRIGIAYDEAFHFYYDWNLALLEAAGARLVRFSPVQDRDLPKVDGLYLGGGYPETWARELSENRGMLDAIRRHAVEDRPIYAECGGLMYLSDGIRTLDGAVYPMVGLLPGIAVMQQSLQAIGYVEVLTHAPSVLGPADSRWRGHQFRYSTLEPAPPESMTRVYEVTPRWGAARFTEGYCRGGVVGSYVHSHWASNPAIASNFVASCASRRR